MSASVILCFSHFTSSFLFLLYSRFFFFLFFFFFNDTATTEIYTLSLHDALPIYYPKKKGIKDECSRLLEASTMKSRRGFAIQRLMNAMRQAHADGWRSEERRVGKECRSRWWQQK